MTNDEPDPVRLGEDVTITDVLVDWNVRVSNPPGLYFIVDGTFSDGEWLPLSGEHTRGVYLSENDYGVFRGWQDGLPVSEETGSAWSPDEVPHEDGALEQYESLTHVVTSRQNAREPESVFGVRMKANIRASTTEFPVRVEVAQAAVDRYLNGPLGTDNTSFWVAYRNEKGGWARANTDREEYEPYTDAEVVLVSDSIYTWHPYRAVDVPPSDRVYSE